MFPNRIVPLSVRVSLAVAFTLFLLPYVASSGTGAQALGLLDVSSAVSRGDFGSLSFLIACLSAGVATAVLVNAAGYAAELLGHWLSEMFGLVDSARFEPKPVEDRLLEHSTLRALISLSVAALLFSSPLSTLLLTAVVENFIRLLASLDQSATGSLALGSLAPASEDLSLLFLSAARLALFTSGALLLPFVLIAYTVDLISFLYRRYFKLGYAPEAMQVARFFALNAVLSSGFYFFIQHINNQSSLERSASGLIVPAGSEHKSSGGGEANGQ